LSQELEIQLAEKQMKEGKSIEHKKDTITQSRKIRNQIATSLQKLELDAIMAETAKEEEF
jgi:hypothetical protein